ncbi:molybdopterin-guanine dinucleotide biosynthesis protein B [Paenibacillus mesophilus]|uniref:molybdopterin-guanine dinucleotide biosynthesis protein B n=1 Tax=Paenibacillus mesophilus TaxID=2582849 RepID=UPI001EE45819|nr:molybdopterin-guanine dinucleotide biosynthesis protein B [Paenibacillus mesophilus]
MERKTPVIGFAGFSDSGKTTLAVQVVGILRREGYRVAVIKHDAHGHYREVPGTDSSRYAEAGADAVVVVSQGRTIKYENLEGAGLDDAIAGLTGYDLIIAEGFKSESHPKIVVFRNAEQAEAIQMIRPDIVAFAVKRNAETSAIAMNPASPVPVLDIDDPEAVAAFVLRHFSYIP